MSAPSAVSGGVRPGGLRVALDLVSVPVAASRVAREREADTSKEDFVAALLHIVRERHHGRRVELRPWTPNEGGARFDALPVERPGSDGHPFDDAGDERPPVGGCEGRP